METAPSGTRKTILIVDDDSQIVGLVSAILADQGFEIITAANGEEGMKKSRAFTGEIALLLTDFQMPAMSGIELATLLTATRPKIKVLMMSGFPDGMLILNEGWHFLAKPFVGSQLRSIVIGLVYPDKDSRFLADRAQG